MHISGNCLLVLLPLIALAGSSPAPGQAVEKIDPVGRPDYKVGKQTGVAIWYESGVWHIRAGAKEKRGREKEIIEGAVTVQKGRIVRGELAGLEQAPPKPGNKNRGRDRKLRKAEHNDDDITVHKSKAGFDFTFVSRGHADGVDFTVSEKAETITFRIRIGGDDNPKQIVIGKSNARPRSSTFVLPAKPAS